jgi:hypothetical protein
MEPVVMTTLASNPVLRWEDPPPARTSGHGRPIDPDSPTRRLARTLADNPGRWAVIREGPVQQIRNVRTKYTTGIFQAFTPVTEWEFVVRTATTPHAHGVLYGRYLGPHTSGVKS